jgi:hypothetical protein
LTEEGGGGKEASERDRVSARKGKPDIILSNTIKRIIKVFLHLVKRENNECKEKPLKKTSK